ncbi:hypothetical protein [Streptomyces sp. NPDC003247]|uniref:hypothetical protein n=1 Tax=Streptomyces sp. NPDC003247 TaxID=3364677 RepID=UPI0036747E48
MRKRFTRGESVALAAVLTAAVWGVSRALAVKDAQVERLIGALEKAAAGGLAVESGGAWPEASLAALVHEKES